MRIKLPVYREVIGLLLLMACFRSHAQNPAPEHCGTMPLLEQKFKLHPGLKAKFEAREKQFKDVVNQRAVNNANGQQRAATLVTVPVVFHIVLSNPALVTDAQIQAQLDTLNKDYAGINGDTVNIPSWFKPLFGNANIQFCLAQQTPDGEPTTGIERVTTSHAPFVYLSADVKHTSLGGADAWNTDNFYNVWLCELDGGLLGYAEFPDDGSPDEQGVVVEYRSVPGGAFTDYNAGKTLSHETGHYFNLYHIWGDDNGACTGTDYVDDTPNQANYTSGCPSGVVVDACTTKAPGILYQNYMDYSSDQCMVMFTVDQAARMQSAAITYRPTLFTSPGCQPAVLNAYDTRLKAITQPGARVCSSTFSPVVTLRNISYNTLTSLSINTVIDGTVVSTYNWTGSLASETEIPVTLSGIAATSGSHTLEIYTSNPNGHADQQPTNDTLSATYMYYPTITPPMTESFEGALFPPQGWDIINPDGSYTWQLATGIAKTGSNSVVIQNYYYGSYGQQDYLRLPQVNIGNTDSAFLTFQVAAATYTPLGTQGNAWDTLQVLISTDCGNTYTSLYKKWANTLVTVKTASATAFVPTADEWRKDSVDLTPYIAQGNVMLAFVNTNENGNNIYLDDINVYKKSVNPNLKAKGFMVTPNPASGMVTVQFYPQPVNLRGVEIYSMAGLKVAEIAVSNGQASNTYTFNIGDLIPGVYTVRAVFSDKVITNKLLKLK